MNVVQFPGKSVDSTPVAASAETLSPELALRTMKGLVAGMVEQAVAIELSQEPSDDEVVFYFKVGMKTDADSAEKLKGCFEQLVEWVIADPENRPGEIPGHNS